MKKFGLLLSLFFLISLAACQNGSTVTSSTPRDTYNSPDSGILESEPLSSEEPSESPEDTEPAKRDDADFRNAKWGDSIETVLEYETEIELNEIDGTLIGSAVVNNFDAYAIYFFDNNECYQGAYSFNLEYTNAGQYIPTYNSLKESLTKKYGEPSEDVIIPLERESLIDMAGEAKALEYGYEVYRARWETSTTDIMLGMGAENFEVSLIIQYIDKAYEPDINDSGL